jgi:hypothetical protein
MKHELIKTKHYLLVVSDDVPNDGDKCLANGKTYDNQIVTYVKSPIPPPFVSNLLILKKIIAHIPLPIKFDAYGQPLHYLDGVDVLPRLIGEAEQLANDYANEMRCDDGTTDEDFLQGFNKAKEIYKYTLEDVINIAEYCRNPSDGLMRTKDLVKEYFLELNNQQEETTQVTCFQCGGSGKRTVSTTYPNEASCFICNGNGNQTKSVVINQAKLPIAFERTMEKVTIVNGSGMFPTDEPKTFTNSEGRTEWVGKYLF